jgi:hypothetical protein
MTDLRTRIAQVLQPRLLSDMRWPDTPIATRNAEVLADAVIEQLGLRQDYDPYSEPESSRYRYVTEWTADDETH